MLTLTRLRMVSAIVAHGSMREAAEALTYTTPALSQQISRLERELGVALFERVPRGVVPTVAGQRLAEISDRVISLVEAAHSEMRDHAERVTGVLRLGSFPSGSATIVPPAIHRFLADHPRADVGLREAEPDDLVELLRTSQIDVGLIYTYQLVPRVLPRELTVHHLRDDPIHVLGPRAGRAPRRIGELAHENWIGTEVGTAGAENLQLLCEQHDFSPVVRYRTNDYDVVQALVGAGLGFALVPEIALRPSRTVATVAVKPAPPPRSISAIFRSSDPNPMIPPLIEVLAAVVTGGQPISAAKRPTQHSPKSAIRT